MKNNAGKNVQKRTIPEFWLVVIMLIILTILVVVILIVPIQLPGGADAVKASELLEYRKTILTIILTAFGAWVGAGAAYFFGRENLRVATESLLQMHQTSAERFKEVPVRNLPRKRIDWTVKASDTLDAITPKINRKTNWFIPIVRSDGKLENVIHEGAVWHFIDAKCKAGTAHADIMKKTIGEVVDYIKKDDQLRAEFDSIYLAAGLDDKAGEVHEQMLRKDIYLGIVNDANGKPIEFFTTGDMRIFLLQAT